jgi:hypothetical protein
MNINLLMTAAGHLFTIPEKEKFHSSFKWKKIASYYGTMSSRKEFFK